MLLKPSRFIAAIALSSSSFSHSLDGVLIFCSVESEAGHKSYTYCSQVISTATGDVYSTIQTSFQFRKSRFESSTLPPQRPFCVLMMDFVRPYSLLLLSFLCYPSFHSPIQTLEHSTYSCF
ncbi:hypothetical protein OCU04_002645 [Sclerotinia nivalis]|uniref:Uncharacterized protein n=1 Tax=Sclerotinia nivalis TaxID=352851 RepID=A0A9X0AUJ6_9HELO|nr:hypothetical protein OCU04_002645 [Sclerotinia nivalis]